MYENILTGLGSVVKRDGNRGDSLSKNRNNNFLIVPRVISLSPIPLMWQRHKSEGEETKKK